MCGVSAKNIELYGSWSSSVFNFPDKKPGFSKTIDLCPNFCMIFSITELVLSTDKIKPQKTTTQTTLISLDNNNKTDTI